MRRLVIGVAMLAFIGGGAALYASSRPGGETAGPLRLPANQSAGAIITKSLSGSVEEGTILTSNPASQPAVLDRVSLIGATSGLALRGAFAALAGRDTPQGAVAMSQWPPEGEHLHPLSAVPVPPNTPDRSHGNVQIVLKLGLDHPGTATFRSVALDYHIGSHRYHAVIPLAFRLCYPASRYAHSCEPSLPSQLE